MHTACMHTTAHVRTAKCHPKGHESRSASSRYSVVVVVVLLLQQAAARIVVRRRLQAASSRLCRRHDKRNRRWPLAQSHQGTTPAVSSSLKRSARQAREQKADGAWRWEGRLVVERRLLPILTRVGRRCSNCWLAPHRLPYAHQSVDPKRGEQGSSIASLRLRAVSGRGSLQKAARTLVAATHGRWEIDTATRNSLYHGTFHHRPAHVMLILMLNATSSVGTLSVLVSSFSFVCQRGSAYLGPLRASPAVHSDLHAFF